MNQVECECGVWTERRPCRNCLEEKVVQQATEIERLRATAEWLTSRVATLESDRLALADYVGEDRAVEIISKAATAAEGGDDV